MAPDSLRSPADGKKQHSLAICGKICSSFVLMILAKEDVALSACLKSAPVYHAHISISGRARRAVQKISARTANRRLSQPRRFGRRDRSARRGRRETDAHGDKGDSRPPHAGAARGVFGDPGQPAQRGAAHRPHSAMTGANLKAVDRVVRIVRELDAIMGFSPPHAAIPRRRLSRRPWTGPRRLARRSSAARNLRCKILKRLNSRSGRLQGR